MRGAEHHARFSLHTMTDNPAATMIADWRQSVYRTFEAIERVSSSTDRYLKRLIVLVAANFASAHIFSPPFVPMCKASAIGKIFYFARPACRSWIPANHRAINTETRDGHTW